jgi:uncharacterized RDD family membrane protein YckC
VTAAATALPATPGLWRRLAAFTYEGVLLFGVVMAAGLIYATVTEQSHALVGQTGLQVWLFLVLGFYFCWFWVRHGQTLAMRTWHIRLVRADGAPPGWSRAIARYVLAWMWFLPALAVVYLAQIRGGWAVTGIVIVGVLTYAGLARLHPSRQFIHDLLCGTRLVDAGTARGRMPRHEPVS